MRKQVYMFVKQHLAGVSAVAYVDLWNDQMRFIEEEPPFALSVI